jgi:hypothetical protein
MFSIRLSWNNEGEYGWKDRLGQALIDRLQPVDGGFSPHPVVSRSSGEPEVKSFTLLGRSD